MLCGVLNNSARVIGVLQQSVDWFIPAEQRDQEFALRRARIIVVFSFILAVWGPPLAVICFLAPGAISSALASLLATLIVAHVPFTLRYTRSLVVAGNCLILNVFLIVSYLSYITGGLGAPPLAWDVALPMFAVAIVGYRYGLLWTAVTLFAYAGFYIYDQLGYHVPRQWTEDQLKLLNFTVLCGLLLIILSMTLLYESNQNRSFQLLKASNDKLAETSAHLQAIIDNAPDGILTFDTAGIIRSFNPAAARLFEYKAAEVIGQPLKMLMPLPSGGQDGPGLVKDLKEDVGSDARTGGRIIGRRKSGQWFPLHVAVGMTCFSSKRLLTCILRDVTELAIAEEQRQQFVALIEHSSDFICMAGEDQRLSYLNSAARRLVGISPEAQVSESWLHDYFTEQTWATIKGSAIPAAMSVGAWQGEGQLRHFISGSPIDVHLNVFLLRDPRGPGMLCIEAVPSKSLPGDRVELRGLRKAAVPRADQTSECPISGASSARPTAAPFPSR